MCNNFNEPSIETPKDREVYALLQIVTRVASILLQSKPDEFDNDLRSCLNILGKIVDVNRIYIWKNHTVNGRLFCTQLYEWSEGVDSQQGNEFTVDISYDESIPNWEAILSKGHCINSIVRDMSHQEQMLLSPQGILSILAVPVFFQDQFWGFIGFDDCHRERLFTDVEEMILRLTSQLITNVLLRVEEANKVRKANEYIKLMLDSIPLCSQLWDKDHNLIDCNMATIKLYGFKNKQECLDNFHKLSPEYQSDGQRSDAKSSMYIKKAIKDGNYTFDWEHQMLDGTIIPLEITFVRVGYENDYFIVSHMRDLRNIKKLEENIQLLTSEVDKIYYDALTGVYNRRFFDKAMKNILKTLSRSESSLSLMMVDIDFFKRYNDTYGHIEGDNCLKTVADILIRNLKRTDDFIAKYGGDEFIVVLPNTNENGARLVADNMLKDVRNCNMLHEQSDVENYVTISIGITASKVDPTHNINDYVKKADDLLYKSKQGGRNRYTFENI